MNPKTLDGILSDKHKEIGLYLEEDADNLFLISQKELFPVAVFSSHAAIEAIHEAADQYMGELTSGIGFERSVE